jgi:hypothetical protein
MLDIVILQLLLNEYNSKCHTGNIDSGVIKLYGVINEQHSQRGLLMALVKYNNNSISAVTSAASIPSGAMTHIKTVNC